MLLLQENRSNAKLIFNHVIYVSKEMPIFVASLHMIRNVAWAGKVMYTGVFITDFHFDIIKLIPLNMAEFTQFGNEPTL